MKSNHLIINNNYSQRNTSVEILRLFFMIGIVIMHVYSHGSKLNYDWIYSLGGTLTTAPHLMLFAFGKLGVTGFMLISGYYGIKLGKRSLGHLIITCFIYFAILYLLTKGSAIEYFLHPWDVWWFVGAYVQISLLSPFIDIGFELIDKQRIHKIIVFLIIFSYVGHFLSIANETNVSLLLTIYITGRYLRKFPPHMSVRQMSVICLILLIIWTTIPVIIEMFGFQHRLQRLFLNNNNILLLIITSLMVLIANKSNFRITVLNYILSSVLSIYLITDYPGVRNIFNSTMLPWILRWYGIILILCVCTGCLFVGIVINKLTRMIIHKMESCHIFLSY